jgi:hypothetical protein
MSMMFRGYLNRLRQEAAGNLSRRLDVSSEIDHGEICCGIGYVDHITRARNLHQAQIYFYPLVDEDYIWTYVLKYLLNT